MVNVKDTEELVADFWKSLENSRTVMLGLVNSPDGGFQPMTAQVYYAVGDTERRNPEIYFFASHREGIGRDLQGGSGQAILTFAARDHEIFASVHGRLVAVHDHALIDELWSPAAAVYYPDGKDDTSLLLLRLDTERASLWRSDTSGFLKSVAYKLIGRDAGHANPEDRADVAL